jgi:enoyl-CoA hydratase/carnithine racemase
MNDAAGMNHWIDPNGIVHVLFDRPDDKVNLLTPAILEDLSDLLDSVRGREDVRGVLFKSAKPGCFIAGMDVEVIAAFTDAFKAAEGARFGQIVFQKIADLPVPSAVAIDGSCLGGGTELASAWPPTARTPRSACRKRSSASSPASAERNAFRAWSASSQHSISS